jgi:hypothetical protein
MERAKHFIATCRQYSSLSVNEGGMNDRSSYSFGMTTLRDEFVCPVPGRLINLNIKFRAEAQKRCFAREDEIHGDVSTDIPKEYELQTFISPSLPDSDEYWRHVAMKCFALSTQFGLQPFFLH